MAFRRTDAVESHHKDDSKERRLTKRYPIPLELDYAVIGSGVVTSGSGKVIDISSSGIRFASGAALPLGEKLISLSLDWPIKGSGGVPLKLLVWGQVRRRIANEVVVRFRKYEIQYLPYAQQPTGSSSDWRLGIGSSRRSQPEQPTVTPVESQDDPSPGGDQFEQ